MVVRPSTCCGNSQRIGTVFTALAVGGMSLMRNPFCSYCWAPAPDTKYVLVMANSKCIQASRLKRIDPPATGDEVSTRREKEEIA